MLESYFRAAQLQILADSALWRLPDERWNEIDRLLARCEEHVLDRNAAQLRAAVDDLILAAPGRVSKRISAAEQAPVRVRERIGVLIRRDVAAGRSARIRRPGRGRLSRPGGSARSGSERSRRSWAVWGWGRSRSGW